MPVPPLQDVPIRQAIAVDGIAGTPLAGAPLGKNIYDAVPVLAGASTTLVQVDNSAGYRTLGWQMRIGNILADPTAAAVLAQAAGSSSFTLNEVVHVLYAFITAAGSTNISPDASITITTAGDVITTSLTLPTGATGVDLFVGTTFGALELASIAANGTITYSGGLSAGLVVTVNGSTLTITISAAASGTGAAQPTSNTSTPSSASASFVLYAPSMAPTPPTNSGVVWYNSGTHTDPANSNTTPANIAGLPTFWAAVIAGPDSLAVTLDLFLGA